MSIGLLRPKDARLAEGELDGEAGDESTKLRRLAGGRAAGAAGESQKKDPSPGEPLAPLTLLGAGEGATAGLRTTGESMSMRFSSIDVVERGERTGSVSRLNRLGWKANLAEPVPVSSFEEVHCIGIPPLFALFSGTAGGNIMPALFAALRGTAERCDVTLRDNSRPNVLPDPSVESGLRELDEEAKGKFACNGTGSGRRGLRVSMGAAER